MKGPEPARWRIRTESTSLRYGLAVIITLAAFLLRLALGAGIGEMSPFLTFYPALVLCAIVGGTGPGVLATVVGALAAKLFFMPPYGDLAVLHAADATALILFCGMGLALSFLGGRLRAMHRREAAHATRAQAAADESARLLQKLNQGEERFRLVVEHAPNAMVMADQRGQIVLVNAQAEALFGYSRGEMIGEPVEMLVSQRFRARHPEYREQFAAEPKARPMGVGRDLYGLCKDGSEVPVEIGLNPIRTDNGLLVLASIVNITERKRAEAGLRESRQQLQAANQTLEQRVTERTAEAQRRAEQLRVLARQLTRAEQKERQRITYVLHEHFQQLLVGAKFNLGMVRLQMRDPSVVPSLAEVDGLLDEAIRESRSLTTELSPAILYQTRMSQVLQWLGRWVQEKHGLRVEVRADEKIDPQDPQLRELIFRAARELLLNVVKHAETNRATIELAQAGQDQLRVTVADRGAGFDPEALRTDATTDAGFGLFDIRERLELLGGRFEIESARGVGTRVSLWLPQRLPAPDRGQGAEPAEQKVAGPGSTREMPGVHVVGLSMHVESDIAEAMSAAGAVAYLTKTAPPAELVAAVRHHADA